MTKPTRDPRTGRFVAAPKPAPRPPDTLITRDQLPPLTSDRILGALDKKSSRAQVAAGNRYIEHNYSGGFVTYDKGPLVTARPRKRRWPRILAAVLLLALAAAVTITLIAWARR